MKKLILPFLILLFSCTKNEPTPIVGSNTDSPYVPDANMVTALPATSQRSGDFAAGLKFLTEGSYVISGIPAKTFFSVFGKQGNNELNRTGDAANLNYDYNITKSFNGVDIVVPSCLGCHADFLNDKLVVGLGNTTNDFTRNQGSSFSALFPLLKPDDSLAFYPLYRGVTETSKYLLTDVVGINPADQLAEVLVSHRDKNTLQWLDKAQFEVPTQVYPTDVPAWWLLKKKNALYYAGWGRGDMAKMISATMLLTVRDSSDFVKNDKNFVDVLAYLKAITPPKYPQNIDPTLASQGQKVFINKCSGCHGTYEKGQESYPNLLVSKDLVMTDPYLINNEFHRSQYYQWYSDSYFSKISPSAKIVNGGGYVAPPLDGIWATAPYLHNGSVPTLEDLLNSSQRPKYWKRTYKSNDLNYQKVGWNYTAEAGKTDKFTYDTTKPGYGNTGHTFGDGLSVADRKALIEYLKTL